MQDIQQLLEDIIKSIVQKEESVEAKREADEMGILFRVWVDKSDMGLVIGRAGVTASAIKQIIRMIGYKTKSNISVKFEEPINK